ncbi:MAG: ROK family protein [Deltaproteobacteria bacterium]|nr:ROK family protein [Deltaproteobacteria bacterium]
MSRGLPLTLCFDVGGTAIKALVVGPGGSAAAQGEPVRAPTPRGAGPDALLGALVQIAAGAGAFDRVAIGFPGVVHDGVTYSAPNLGPGWEGFPLASRAEERLGVPVRVANDADLHGLAVIQGRGVEMLLTLGTGMGSAVYVDGRLVPNLELGHHPFGDGRTYEERIADAELARVGESVWRERVIETVDQVRRIWNFRKLYLGGGNARLLRQQDLPDDVRLVDNSAGVRAGVRLFEAKP